jgi:putative SOS response-associated peptidase YedK
MCNAYRVKPKHSDQGRDAAVSDEIRRLPSDLVRRTGPGVVVTLRDGQLVPATMRWGFHRPFSDAVNNARSDNFKSTVWSEALAFRRCLVPMSAFYEWQSLPKGGKQAYEFRREDGDWIWVAGLWEDSEKLGPCYATITTEPSDLVKPIHDRMLAIVDIEVGEMFLRGAGPDFNPYTGPLITAPCVSPLKRTKEQAPDFADLQGNLF